MIPELLSLRNFFSYREAALDLRGLQAACICGPNGAGKSSLLEAIAWVLWGKGRAVAIDDIIHQGEAEARVDFTFRIGQEVYRTIRTRRRNQSSSLEFQVAAAADSPEARRFRSLTERNLEATQAAIIRRLRLDYDTFVNSAYLRQGRADEFMLKKPAERKQVLAELLKLSQYEELAEAAKERAKAEKFAADRLTETIATHHLRLEQRAAVAADVERLAGEVGEVRDHLDRLEVELARWQALALQRQTWQEQQTWQESQQRAIAQEVARLVAEAADLERQQAKMAAVLAQAADIEAQAARLATLQAQEEDLSQRSERHAALGAQRQAQQQTIERDRARTEAKSQQLAARLADLDLQSQEQSKLLAKAPEIEAALSELNQARANLDRLERLQGDVVPLVHRQQEIETERERLRARLAAGMEHRQGAIARGQQQMARLPQLEADLAATIERVSALEARQVYQDRVREKGLERKSFLDRLEATRSDLQQQLAKLAEKARLLREREGDAPDSEADELAAPDFGQRDPTDLGLSAFRSRFSAPQDYGTCPLCDRPLDEHHWQHVLEQHQRQETDLREQLWIVGEQMAVTERERQVLREEYRSLQEELKPLGSLLERRGQLQEQLQGLRELVASTRAAEEELAHWRLALGWIEDETGAAAPDPLPEVAERWRSLRGERSQLLARLGELNWDDRDLALARGEVDRLRWADLRAAELQQARKRLETLREQRPRLAAEQAAALAELQRLQDATLPDSPLAALAAIDAQLAALDYHLEAHNRLRGELRAGQVWLGRAEELRRCREEAPRLADRQTSLQTAIATRTADQQHLAAQLAHLAAQLAQSVDPAPEMARCTANRDDRRRALESLLADRARLEQELRQLDQCQQQLADDGARLDRHRHQQRIYDELTKAFGKNGIQTLAIETVLPQLEAEANRLLGQLSANQLHVQFITQRAKKTKTPKVGAKARKKADGGMVLAPTAIETLDILIADPQGTRPYETYSGGEAFRINFAIRLALSRLLAQRAGTSLQLLIIDEGFGTQDETGRDRLVAAINAIAPDFACILAVTHIPALKEAFSTRIDVQKTSRGSEISFSM